MKQSKQKERKKNKTTTYPPTKECPDMNLNSVWRWDSRSVDQGSV